MKMLLIYFVHSLIPMYLLDINRFYSFCIPKWTKQDQKFQNPRHNETNYFIVYRYRNSFLSTIFVNLNIKISKHHTNSKFCLFLLVEFFSFLCRSVVHSNVRLSSLNGALGDQRGIPFTSGIHQASGWRSFDFDAFADLAQGGVSMILCIGLNKINPFGIECPTFHDFNFY